MTEKGTKVLNKQPRKRRNEATQSVITTVALYPDSESALNRIINVLSTKRGGRVSASEAMRVAILHTAANLEQGESK